MEVHVGAALARVLAVAVCPPTGVGAREAKSSATGLWQAVDVVPMDNNELECTRD